jgi:hypothetical protein
MHASSPALTRSLALALVACAAAVGLASCAPAGSFTIFDREPEPADQFPADTPMDAFGKLMPDTIRFVAADDGDQLYLAKDVGGGICLAIVHDDVDFRSGCGGEGGTFEVTNSERTYYVQPDGSSVPDAARRISGNVSVVEQESIAPRSGQG